MIASQAVITGVFSLTRQAIQLGYLPRMEIHHTSDTSIGQIYIPRVNWLLMSCVVALVVGFGSSGALAGAYGLAVTGAMLVDAALAMAVAILVWRWSWPLAAAVFGFLAIPDLAFFIANALKIPDGGWLPMIVASLIYFTIMTWRRGRRLVAAELSEGSLPLKQFLERMERAPDRVAGTAVFLTADAGHTPAAFLHNLKHNKVLHERIIILQVDTMDVPVVPEANRVEVERLGKGFHTVIAHYGFTEQPDIPEALRACRPHGIAYDEMETSFFLGRETLVPSQHSKLGRWRRDWFISLSHSASATKTFFRIPPTALSNSATRSRSEAVRHVAFSARPAAGPAQHAPRLRPSGRGAGRHRRLHHPRALAPRHDGGHGRGDPRPGAADLRPLRLLDGRLRRLRDIPPRAAAGRTHCPDGHPGRPRFARDGGAAARLHRADPHRPLPWRASDPAAPARPSLARHRPGGHAAPARHGDEVGGDGFVREQQAILAAPTAGRCWSRSKCRRSWSSDARIS